MNLTVVDLQENRQKAVFDRQVALGGWNESFQPTPERRLRFDDLLFLTARTTDTTADGRIDSRDAAYVYTYRLTTSELRRISPEEYSAAGLEVRPSEVVLMLRRESDSARAAVYVYDPVTEKGHFVTEELLP